MRSPATACTLRSSFLRTRGCAGERCSGLRWKDVDLERAALWYLASLVLVAYQPQLSDVKTNNGRKDDRPRTEDHRGFCEFGRRLKSKSGMLANLRPTADLIIAHPDGSVINPDYLSQVFDRHVAKSALPSNNASTTSAIRTPRSLKEGVPLKS